MSTPATPASVAIGTLSMSPPFGVAPMAGLTDSAFRRLVKRIGGCGLVVSEMVSAEGLIRGIDRTLEFARFTEEERPVSIQIFGGDPDRMAAAAKVVEARGADVVDVNMGCPVPKIAHHAAGCNLMREPERAARIVSAMVKGLRVPVTVKMRAGWDDREINAPALARRLEEAGAAALTVHGRTAAQSYGGHSDWDLIARVATAVSVPVLGNGDCLDAEDTLRRMRASGVAGVLVGRGVLRNPWLLAQTADLALGQPARTVTAEDRGRFLLAYVDLLLTERPPDARRGRRASAEADRAAQQAAATTRAPARGHDRWVINKLRALVAWFSKGLEGGSKLRALVNTAESVADLRGVIERFFFEPSRVC